MPKNNPTHADFDQACINLLGEQAHKNHSNSGWTPHQFCREIADLAFIDALKSDSKESLDLVKWVAKNLWAGEGVTGLTK